ncbi:transposase [Saccharopolyspora griseoalba]|uniref:Transposase n=1 Tax=Saccharopolyspora griseoalba TaxID=1431848 RepID=A0ABW2LQD8_9PSEU
MAVGLALHTRGRSGSTRAGTHIGLTPDGLLNHPSQRPAASTSSNTSLRSPRQSRPEPGGCISRTGTASSASEPSTSHHDHPIRDAPGTKRTRNTSSVRSNRTGGAPTAITPLPGSGDLQIQRRKFSPQFKAEAVQLVASTCRPVAEVARELEIDAGTSGNWVHSWRDDNPGSEPDRPAPVPAGRVSGTITAVYRVGEHP